MKVRAAITAALTLAVLCAAAPAADAATGGGFRPVEQPDPRAVVEALRGDVPVAADVFDGRYVARGEHPYVGLVLIVDPETGTPRGSCSGSLIRARHVLTAGHCTHKAQAAVFVPKVVDLNRVTERDVFTASGVATAPRYSPRTLRNDIGLLKLARPVRVTPVKVAGTADDGRYGGGTKARVVGWGAVNRKLHMPDRLRKGAITLRSARQCARRWGGAFRPANMICGGSRVTDTCVGDSGGPLLVRRGRQWLLVGTTSFGRTQCAPATDSVYARVVALRPWIERLTGLPKRR